MTPPIALTDPDMGYTLFPLPSDHLLLLSMRDHAQLYLTHGASVEALSGQRNFHL